MGVSDEYNDGAKIRGDLFGPRIERTSSYFLNMKSITGPPLRTGVQHQPFRKGYGRRCQCFSRLGRLDEGQDSGI